MQVWLIVILLKEKYTSDAMLTDFTISQCKNYEFDVNVTDFTICQ